MDIAQAATWAGIAALTVYNAWWLIRRAQSTQATKTAPDALATFNELVGALKSNGKLDDAVQASIIAIREAVAEIAMPLDSDAEATQ